MPRHSIPLVDLTCSGCGVPIQRKPRHVNPRGNYCTAKCYYEASKRQAPERFWTKVDQSGGEDACWPWMGARSPEGYGVCHVPGMSARASRVAYILTYGPVSDVVDICHDCDNPPCCNPKHLFPGTRKVNIQDMVTKGRHKPVHLPGDSNPNAKLTRDQVVEIKQLLSQGMTQRAIAQQFGVTRTHIGYIARGKSWSDV